MGKAQKRKQLKATQKLSSKQDIVKKALNDYVAKNPHLKKAYDFIQENLELKVIEKTDYVNSFNHYWVSITDIKTQEKIEGCIHVFATLDNELHNSVYPDFISRISQSGESIRKIIEEEYIGTLLFNEIDAEVAKAKCISFVLDSDAPPTWLNDSQLLNTTTY